MPPDLALSPTHVGYLCLELTLWSQRSSSHRSTTVYGLKIAEELDTLINLKDNIFAAKKL